jgi:Ca-activated chloride channel family protein
VESEDRLDEVMTSVHRRIGSPLVTGIALEPTGLSIVDGTVAPARLPDLFPGVPLVIRGRYRGSGKDLRVHGRAPDGAPWRDEVTGQRHDSAAATAIWARAHLRDLEDRYATASGYGHAGDAELERRIVAASLRFGVLCRFTAYVAVDQQVVADGGPQHRVIQPVEPVEGWDMLGTGALVPASYVVPAGPAAAAAPMMPPPGAAWRMRMPTGARPAAEDTTRLADTQSAPLAEVKSPPVASSAPASPPAAGSRPTGSPPTDRPRPPADAGWTGPILPAPAQPPAPPVREVHPPTVLPDVQLPTAPKVDASSLPHWARVQLEALRTAEAWGPDECHAALRRLASWLDQRRTNWPQVGPTRRCTAR